MGHNKHKCSELNMQPRSQGSLLPALRGTRLNKHVVLPQKIVILHPYLPITATSPQRPFSSPPEVVVLERFDCTINSTYLISQCFNSKFS